MTDEEKAKRKREAALDEGAEECLMIGSDRDRLWVKSLRAEREFRAESIRLMEREVAALEEIATALRNMVARQ